MKRSSQEVHKAITRAAVLAELERSKSLRGALIAGEVIGRISQIRPDLADVLRRTLTANIPIKQIVDEADVTAQDARLMKSVLEDTQARYGVRS